jgi:TolB protein
MNSRTSKGVIAAVLLLWSLFLSPFFLHAEEQGEYIAIRKQGGGKIALVLDRAAAKGGKESEWAQEFDKTVKDGLGFSNLFSILPPPSNVRAGSDGKAGGVNFGALSSVGAEVYAGGVVSKKGGKVNIDMEVYDTFGTKLLLKKSYSGKEEHLRSLGHAFCADLIELLTGKKSFFGSKIVFISSKTGSKEVYRCDFDGHGVEQVTNFRSISLTPVLSPDGRYLAYTSYTSGRPTLYIRNLQDNKISSVAKNGVSVDPSWRNATELATTLSFEGDQEIYLVRPDGGIVRRLTNSKGIDVSPTFSADGRQMAFVSARNGLPQIFIQDMQSGLTRRLTYSGRYNTQPSWSPAGDKIAYSTWEKTGEINIFVINADGSGLKRLTSGVRENESPSWSPDGSMIVFTSNRQGGKKLYVMSSNGENQRRLLQVDGDQMQPSWSLFR